MTLDFQARFDATPALDLVVKTDAPRETIVGRSFSELVVPGEAMFSEIIAMAADAIISIDDEQRITMFNDGAEKIFGYARAEVLGAQASFLAARPAHTLARTWNHVRPVCISACSART